MVTHGRSGIGHFFKDSVAENVSSYGTIPVLTYNISKKKIDRSAKPITRTTYKKRTRENKL
jgi:hypothetical protein